MKGPLLEGPLQGALLIDRFSKEASQEKHKELLRERLRALLSQSVLPLIREFSYLSDIYQFLVRSSSGSLQTEEEASDFYDDVTIARNSLHQKLEILLKSPSKSYSPLQGMMDSLWGLAHASRWGNSEFGLDHAALCVYWAYLAGTGEDTTALEEGKRERKEQANWIRRHWRKEGASQVGPDTLAAIDAYISNGLLIEDE